MSHITATMSKRLKKLRVKHIMDWEELERQQIKSSWIYKAIDAATPSIIGWVVLITYTVIMTVRTLG